MELPENEFIRLCNKLSGAPFTPSIAYYIVSRKLLKKLEFFTFPGTEIYLMELNTGANIYTFQGLFSAN